MLAALGRCTISPGASLDSHRLAGCRQRPHWRCHAFQTDDLVSARPGPQRHATQNSNPKQHFQPRADEAPASTAWQLAGCQLLSQLQPASPHRIQWLVAAAINSSGPCNRQLPASLLTTMAFAGSSERPCSRQEYSSGLNLGQPCTGTSF